MPKVSGYRLRKLMLATWMLLTTAMASAQYPLKFIPVDKDSVFIANTLGLESSFPNRILCNQYINNLTALLMTKGYPSASIDSVWSDSTNAAVKLFVGQAYKLANINIGLIDR